MTEGDDLAMIYGLWGMNEEAAWDRPTRISGPLPVSRRQARKMARKADRAERKAALGSLRRLTDAELRAAALVLPEDTYSGYLVLMHSDQGKCTAQWCARWTDTLVAGAKFGRSADHGRRAGVKTMPLSAALVDQIREVQGDIASGL